MFAWTNCLYGGNKPHHRGGGRCRRRRSLFRRNLPPSNQYIPGQVPIYQISDRDACPLLQACWDQDWTLVSKRCRSHRNEAFVQSATTFRTALHFATMPGVKCPLTTLWDLVETNPHAVIVSDHHSYGGTPCHFACGSAFLRNDIASIKLLVDTALRVQDELATNTTDESASAAAFVRVSHWSPLFLAAKWAAPAQTLDILVQAACRRQALWIAPWTGGESRLQILNSSSSSEIRRHARDGGSPLESLWCKVAYRFEDDDAKLLKNNLPLLQNVTEMLLKDVNHFPNLSCIPSSSSSSLPAAGKNANGSMHDQDDDADDVLLVMDDWVKLVILLRHHVTSTLLNAVACLNRPIPGLVRLVCRLFPDYLLQTASVPVPRQQQQHHQQQQSTMTTMNNEHKKEDDPGVAESLQSSSSEDEEQRKEEQEEVLLLYPALLAACQDAPIDIIFHLLVSAPLVLELQRQAFRGSF